MQTEMTIQRIRNWSRFNQAWINRDQK